MKATSATIDLSLEIKGFLRAMTSREPREVLVLHPRQWADMVNPASMGGYTLATMPPTGVKVWASLRPVFAAAMRVVP